MSADLRFIISFVFQGLLHIWPYLLISIPLAVLIRATDASRYIRGALRGHPTKTILLATLVGAFSPFCSCTVVPVVASLLMSGVPLGPVMAFWIASPSMDLEILALSIGILGWDLALARVIATLILSLSAGYLAHILDRRGAFHAGVLRQGHTPQLRWRDLWDRLVTAGRQVFERRHVPAAHAIVGSPALTVASGPTCALDGGGCGSTPCDTGCDEDTTPSRWRQIRADTVAVTLMIVQFMVLAFLLEALIVRYVPQETIIAALGDDNPLAIIVAALVGVPVYTSNLTALPLIGGLLEQGMSPGAALAFLIAGPTTTLPAMAAVYGIARRRVFALYLGVALLGAVGLGYAYSLM